MKNKQHTAGDRTPYTYVIRFLKTGQIYYGVKFGKHCVPEELGKTYMSSSKVIHDLIKEHGIDAFSFEVRKIFNSKEKAQKHETRILQKFNARNNRNFLNKSNGIIYAPTSHNRNKGPDNPMFGKPGTMLGKNHSQTTRNKMKIANGKERNGFYNKHHTKNSRKMIGDKQRGSLHKRFNGYYHTPHGIFSSSRDAMLDNVSHKAIQTWCKKSHRTITPALLSKSKYLKSEYLGKTFKNIGFWFEPII